MSEHAARVANRDAGTWIAARQPFTGHHMSGQIVRRFGPVPTGRLEPEHAEKLRQAVGLGCVYVVFSYATPIGWWAPATGWVVPDARYSVTTRRHQHIVRAAI